ncbi:Chaperone protein ClpB [Maioricimonas rarisocia]|uniref:Chaperone protein ClpB n=1 Tax=Maioricimonas rarisocia TaxID=2528026 RepID=A0A517ZFJ0_9PLAN|nr:type VI secretion system ATPase TssH [Maioricimonas rarisocia]QDU41245.1 Chaperone protein ClpB [Maioricimonas rarisocia]
MPPLNLKSLIDKLNDTCRATLEAAAGRCMSRTNYNVEVEHWLSCLLDEANCDVSLILRHYGLDGSRVTQGLMKSLDGLKTGNARPPALSPDVVQLVREAWLLASVEFGDSEVRSAYLLAAMLGDETLARQLTGISREFEELTLPTLTADLPKILANSSETTAAPAGGDAGGGPAPAGPRKTQALDQFTVDLTEIARSGKMDPVLGRDAEIRQLVDILTRRRQNNPILTGEAGVGKTAVVEGFAQRIAAGDVPPLLENVAVRTLDMALLQAGAGMKGEFENRLKSVIQEVKSSPQPIILFIDEAHSLIGAGGQAGQGDAANLLKPALARGELRTIAATTWAEYKKYFERDAALARRFQVVKVEEPEEKSAIEMMRGIVSTLEAHHNVRILDEAVVESVRLSRRYISGRQLPDKSVSVLDTACARVAIGQNATPPAVEDARRRIEQLDVAIRILEREVAGGADHGGEIDKLREERETVTSDLEATEQRWQQELELVRSINELRSEIEAEHAAAKEGDAESSEQREKLASLYSQLEELQQDEPLVHVCVDAGAVAAIVGAWTGIPIGRMVSDEVTAVLNLKDRLEESVVGQSHALDAIAQSIQVSRANLTDPTRPIGVFLLAGTSGVGKTETAMTLANLLYGGSQNMTTINMSEFKEEHKVSLLMGSPPGYVGYGEGGVLTEAVRRKPYSVVLLDEMEKAHPGVQDVFYQVFDKGSMKDGEGRDIDFRNTLILMTTNAGTDLIKSLCIDPETRPDAEGLAEVLHEELLKTFKPAFLGRLAVIPYFPLTEDVLERIVRLKLQKITRRVAENYNATLQIDDDVVEYFVNRCNAVDTGARMIDHLLTRTVLPEMSREFLARMARQEPIQEVTVSVEDQHQLTYRFA